MDSPIRQQLKRNDYQRHKLFRKMARRRKAKKEQELKAAEKELKRKLRIPRYTDGKSAYTYIKPLNNVGVDEEGNLRDPEVPSARGTILLPEVTVNIPDWKDVVGRYSIASNDALRVTGLRLQNTHLNKQAEEGAARRAAWARENPGLETAGLIAGAVPFAVAATPAVVGGGELAATALANPYVDAAITSAFAGHGLNHAINESIDGWGDAAMTALELTPLGRLARPVWNAAKPKGNFIPTPESNMSGIRYAYNRNPELANIGTLEDYNDYLKTVFPESKVKDINYHMGPKGLLELKPSTGKVWNTNPDARGIYVTPDKSYAQRIRKYTTTRLENPSIFTYIKRNLIPGGWDKANDAFTDIYPVIIDTKNPLLTKGTWTWGIKDKKYQSIMDDYDAIVNSGPKWYHNTYSMPETIVPKTDQSLILGSDADVAGFRRFMSNGKLTRPVWNSGKRLLKMPEFNTKRVLGSTGSDNPYKYAGGESASEIGKKLLLLRARERMTNVGNYEADEFLDFGLKGNVEHMNEIDPEVMEIFENTVIPRLDEKFLRENGGVEGIKNILREGGYNVADEAAWNQLYGDDTDMVNTIGLNYDSNNAIAIRNYENVQAALPHELRHRLQRAYQLLKQRVNFRKTYLNDAYGSDFANLNTKLPETDKLHTYTRFADEAETTNLDSRNYLFENYADQSLIHQNGQTFGAPLRVQNKIIDAATDELVIESVRNANGYGRRYIEWLMDEAKRRVPKITTEEFYKFYAPRFRNAMKYVPAFAGAGAVGASAISAPLYGYKYGKASGIHIKPENRGKFTALKKRTGHSASWFKKNGTPALKKMATFALNARKWKHK